MFRMNMIEPETRFYFPRGLSQVTEYDDGFPSSLSFFLNQ